MTFFTLQSTDSSVYNIVYFQIKALYINKITILSIIHRRIK